MPYAPRESITAYAEFKVLARTGMRDAPSLAPWTPDPDPYVSAMYDAKLLYRDRWAEMYAGK